MIFNEFFFIYNLLIKDLNFSINKSAIILKTRINEINIININKDFNERKIKTFFNTFYKIFFDFDEKEIKKILIKDILNKKIIKFLKIIIIFFLNINILNKDLNIKINSKYFYFIN